MKGRFYIMLALMLTVCSLGNRLYAQTDPTLAGMILLYTGKAEKSLKTRRR